MPFVVSAALLYAPPLVSAVLRPMRFRDAITVANWLLMLAGLVILVRAFIRRRTVITALALVFTVIELGSLFLAARIVGAPGLFTPLIESLPIEVVLFSALALGGGWWLPLAWILNAGLWNATFPPKQSGLTNAGSIDDGSGPQLTSASS